MTTQLRKTAKDFAKVHWLYQLALGLNDTQKADLEAKVADLLEQYLLQESGELVKALKPFAEWSGNFPSSAGEDVYVYHGKRLGKFTRSACDKAKQVLDNFRSRHDG